MKAVGSAETLPTYLRTKLHGVVSQNTVILILSTVRSSDLITPSIMIPSMEAC
jgi:hypothetical protein